MKAKPQEGWNQPDDPQSNAEAGQKGSQQAAHVRGFGIVRLVRRDQDPVGADRLRVDLEELALAVAHVGDGRDQQVRGLDAEMVGHDVAGEQIRPLRQQVCIELDLRQVDGQLLRTIACQDTPTNKRRRSAGRADQEVAGRVHTTQGASHTRDEQTQNDQQGHNPELSAIRVTWPSSVCGTQNALHA